jgi:DNA-binding MarR family transcriptional regulator
MSCVTEPIRLVHLLRQVTVELNLLAAGFAAENGLHPTDLRAIIHLLDAERAGTVATPGRLGTGLGLNSASVTALLDRLERLGHVRRERDPGDRRRILLSVTPSAKDLGQAYFGPLIDRLVTTMDGYDERDLSAVRRFLTDTLAITAHPK